MDNPVQAPRRRYSQNQPYYFKELLAELETDDIIPHLPNSSAVIISSKLLQYNESSLEGIYKKGL